MKSAYRYKTTVGEMMTAGVFAPIDRLAAIVEAQIAEGSPAGTLVIRERIEQELVQQLGVEPSRAAELFAATGALIAQTVSTGQMDDVRAQLPEPLREVFLEAPVAAAS